MANQSDVFEFVLIGFPGLPQRFHMLVSFIMFLVYNIAVLGNGTVIVLVFLKRHLHQPMYIIIGALSFSDLFFDTATLPKMIATYWFGAGSMSFSGCMTQIFLVHWLGIADSFIIMFMAVDRYIAICNPLRYSILVGNKIVTLSLLFSWISSAIFSLIIIGYDIPLPYCGPNKINNCFCTHQAIIVLACTDVTRIRRIAFYIAMSVHLGPLAIIILSYIIIIKAIHSSTHSEHWQKAFYTCTTHLFVIGLYYVPRLIVYSTTQIPLKLNVDLNILIICLYTFVPHVISPAIYCLRTMEIKRTHETVLKGMIGIKRGHAIQNIKK